MTTIDDTLLIPILEKGDKLYHYTSATGMQGICSGEFWVTESNFLNDFTEFQVATKIFGEVFDKHISNIELCKKLKRRVYDDLNYSKKGPRFTDSTAYSGDYVISFSLDYDSSLMWSEYSDFLGYCLTFDFEKLYKAFGNQTCIQHGRVIYNHDKQIMLFEQAIRNEFFIQPQFDKLNCWEDFDSMTDNDLNDIIIPLSVIVQAYNQFFKLPCFEGEHEYRFIFYCGHDGRMWKNLDKQYFRIKDETLIPFIKRKMLSLDSLEQILIGPKNKSDVAVLGVEYFLRNEKLSVPVVKSQMPLRY